MTSSQNKKIIYLSKKTPPPKKVIRVSLKPKKEIEVTRKKTHFTNPRNLASNYKSSRKS